MSEFRTRISKLIPESEWDQIIVKWKQKYGNNPEGWIKICCSGPALIFNNEFCMKAIEQFKNILSRYHLPYSFVQTTDDIPCVRIAGLKKKYTYSYDNNTVDYLFIFSVQDIGAGKCLYCNNVPVAVLEYLESINQDY